MQYKFAPIGMVLYGKVVDKKVYELVENSSHGLSRVGIEKNQRSPQIYYQFD